MDLAVVSAAIADSYQPPPHGGRPSAIADAPALQVLLTELESGTHPEPAAELAGIAPKSVYNWLKRGEQGEEPFALFLRAYKRARATVESKVTRNIIKASDDPRFWAAGATYLERTHPDRWARRSEDSSAPKVVVQIGVKDSDVQVQIASISTAPSELSPSLSVDMHRLTEAYNSHGV